MGKLFDKLYESYGGKEELSEEDKVDIVMNFVKRIQGNFVNRYFIGAKKYTKEGLANKLIDLGIVKDFLEAEEILPEVLSKRYSYEEVYGLSDDLEPSEFFQFRKLIGRDKILRFQMIEYMDPCVCG